MNKKESLKNTILLSYALSSVLAIYMLIYHDQKYSFKTLPAIMLVVVSFFTQKKIDKRVLIFFLCLIAGDTVIVNFENFKFGLYFHSLSFFILSYLSWSFFKKKTRKEFIKHFITFLILFLIIFFFTINDKGDAYSSIFTYGISICLATSLLFTNYLKMMIPANYMLFLAIATRIVSDSILTIVLFNEYNIYYSVIAHVIYFVSNYLFYKGFSLKYI
ncbi:lysoplasmalogenase family protein [uncultured Tenacibaculum sp.]|uniref:lysoplasmalogenase family protein n=1 Tax=uncultured Tenacibaculum sp. TaxID=174713 RepID=UPI002635081A|nr:lysoplasmalogenase family protein [uncultured Tenacibaculum sp.]